MADLYDKTVRRRRAASVPTGLLAVWLLLGLTPRPAHAQFVSDDFSNPALNTNLWTFVNPLGDASFMMTGSQLELSVPPGASHDPWYPQNTAPRFLQPASDTDFEIEASFESTPTKLIQGHGIIVQAADGRFLRFDVYFANGGTSAFAALISPTSASIKANAAIDPAQMAWLKVNRSGDRWIFWVSADRVNWTKIAGFNASIAVSDVGFFANNWSGNGNTAPAYDVLVDYFFNTASPIDPEDAGAVDAAPPAPVTGLTLSPGVDHLALGWTASAAGDLAGYRVYRTDDPATPATPVATLPATTTLYNDFGVSQGVTYTYYVTAFDTAGNESDPSTTVSGHVVDNDGPTVDVWYGSRQTFGRLGKPQAFIDVLGHADDPFGLYTLEYAVNGGAYQPLSFEPFRRIERYGDFVIELDPDALIVGDNLVRIRATNAVGVASITDVTVDYRGRHVWPLPYTITWGNASTIGDVAEVVDGKWALGSTGVRTVETGYDRLIDIGDVDWTDYEVVVPITPHAIDSTGYQPPNASPVVGLLMRWDGHDAWDSRQPRWGWWPFGAAGWYAYSGNPDYGHRLQIVGNAGAVAADDTTSGKKLLFGFTYLFKMRVETLSGVGGRYSFKVWQAGMPEPAAWDLVAQQGLDDPQKGSLLLLAHYVDATFGDVVITPLSASTPPAITGISATAADTTASIYWTTSKPATARVDYGTTTAYELGAITDGDLLVEHVVNLSELQPETLYHFRITATDAGGIATTSADQTLTTAPSDTGQPFGLVSDDFSGNTLDGNVWTFVDPKQDGGVAMTGTQLALTVPGGVSHDPWYPVDEAPRVMQDAPDTDFEVQAKFESPLSSTIQGHGLVVEEDGGRFIRFDLYYDRGTLKAFAAVITGSGASTRANVAVPFSTTTWIRVRRQGQTWTLFYSPDGMQWTEVKTFDQPLVVSRIGVMANNWSSSGSAAPAYTALVDYFYDISSTAPAKNSLQGASSVATEREVPAPYAISAPYPNPFYGSTRFDVTVAETSPVRIEVFNVLGQSVRLLHDGTLVAGTPYHFRFDGGTLRSGVYFIRALGKDFIAQKKVVLLQ